ncbi:hypothetical protein [Flavobacterium sp. LS1R10]|uniref:hypothetical protein n=1 Tax=Flavobacterium sp. LS1R10 TaxID=2497482 RepID=UPI000F824B0F|nr:hypothetical protein [Flavobacterium sp. LS1R10]RTY72577.1 hypothetical protein EKL96_14105 [Flavobacterium sp. LS1R10]
MNESTLTALATVLLVIVGLAQVVVLIAQKRQTRIALVSEYRQLWTNCKKHWGNVIFIGRDSEEYYQVVDEKTLNELKEKTKLFRLDTPTIWALESIHNVCGVLGEVSTRILQGHLQISDAYPIFGTEFLRHNRPLRQLLDSDYHKYSLEESLNDNHKSIKTEMQDWLIYHDGLRRRCLILIDILWAEAARLEDLPPSDIQSATNAKKITGKLNRKRVFKEVLRLNGLRKLILALKLSIFLGRAEYYSFWNQIGIKKTRLNALETNWTNRLLRNHK